MAISVNNLTHSATRSSSNPLLWLPVEQSLDYYQVIHRVPELPSSKTPPRQVFCFPIDYPSIDLGNEISSYLLQSAYRQCIQLINNAAEAPLAYPLMRWSIFLSWNIFFFGMIIFASLAGSNSSTYRTPALVFCALFLITLIIRYVNSRYYHDLVNEQVAITLTGLNQSLRKENIESSQSPPFPISNQPCYWITSSIPHSSFLLSRYQWRHEWTKELILVAAIN